MASDSSPSVSAQLQQYSQLLATQDHPSTVPASCSPPSLPFWSSCPSSVSPFQVSSVSIPIAPIHRGQQLSLLPTSSCFSSSGRLAVQPFPSVAACPTSVGSPLKVLPCRLRLPVSTPEDVLPCVGNHLMDFFWVGHKCPDAFFLFRRRVSSAARLSFGVCFHSSSIQRAVTIMLCTILGASHFVLPPVPSVFLIHLVRQQDHLFVNFRQAPLPPT